MKAEGFAATVYKGEGFAQCAAVTKQEKLLMVCRSCMAALGRSNSDFFGLRFMCVVPGAPYCQVLASSMVLTPASGINHKGCSTEDCA